LSSGALSVAAHGAWHASAGASRKLEPVWVS